MIATSFIIAQPPIARRRVGNLRPSTAYPRAGNLHRSTGASLRSTERFHASIDRSFNKTLHQTHSVTTISRSQYQHAAPASDPANLTHEYRHAAPASDHPHRNQQFSIIALTDSAGTIVERYTYTAYGASASPLTPPASSLDNRITFTGREWDSTLHLHHFRARMMDPQLGRFCGRDPIGIRGGLAVYMFLRTNPQRYLDAFGLKINQHHLFPEQFRPDIRKLCGGLDIDDWTIDVDAGPRGRGNSGTEHWWWHHGCGKYNRAVGDLLRRGTCCDFIRGMIELIHNTAQCVAANLGKQVVPAIKTKRYRSKNPTDWDPDGLIDQFCDTPDCEPENYPPNPYVDVIPDWVPDDVNNDIYQDIAVVGGCVVAGVLIGEVIVVCCGAAGSAGGVGIGGAAGDIGSGATSCVVRRVVLKEAVQELPLTLAP
ncbi:MAG: RHS repeat-associated core domain-containing protein [Planctomycetota bacterium]|nr:MAG: RHS repeat-associated core domain-containing protein [Planctomycetota bacterium]